LLAWFTQVIPPFVVLEIVPFQPTVQPVLSFKKYTEYKLLPWGSGFCHSHCADKFIDDINEKRK
jgi:hypothetical protein